MLSDNLKSIIDDILIIVGDTSNDWFLIKKLLVNQFPPAHRGKFSRRHYSTKKHIVNSFDKEVITYWESKTNTKVYIDPDKLHPADWKRHLRGWGLKKYNAERRKRIKKLNREHNKERAKNSLG